MRGFLLDLCLNQVNEFVLFTEAQTRHSARVPIQARKRASRVRACEDSAMVTCSLEANMQFAMNICVLQLFSIINTSIQLVKIPGVKWYKDFMIRPVTHVLHSILRLMIQFEGPLPSSILMHTKPDSKSNCNTLSDSWHKSWLWWLLVWHLVQSVLTLMVNVEW